MINNRIAFAMCAVATVGLSGCGKGFAGKIESTPAGVFYSSWTGRLFLVENGMLVRIPPAPASASRTVYFSTKIPGVADSGFPVGVTGAVKFVDGQERLRIDLALGPLGAKQPSVSDQSQFIAGLQNGTGKLKSLDLAFLDADGFPVSGGDAIPTNAGWIAESGPSGISTSFSYVSTGPASPGEASELSKVDVRWTGTNDTSAVDAEAAANAARAAASAAAASAAIPATQAAPDASAPDSPSNPDAGQTQP